MRARRAADPWILRPSTVYGLDHLWTELRLFDKQLRCIIYTKGGRMPGLISGVAVWLA